MWSYYLRALEMQKKIPTVVTIVGAESSGKTVLAKQLAALLGCDWVPEFAREYLENLDRPYEFKDLEEMAIGQWKLIRQGLENAPPVQNKPGIPVGDFRPDLKNIADVIGLLKSKGQHVVIVDAGMLTIRMWAKIKYGTSIDFVENRMREDPTSIYLLCRPRVEWEHDPLREAPGLMDRVWIYNLYLKEIVENQFYYKIVQL